MEYAKIFGPLKKLGDRSKKFKFIGYIPQGYRLWDNEKRKVIISKDARFEMRVKLKPKRESNKDQLRYFKTGIEEIEEYEQKENETEERHRSKG